MVTGFPVIKAYMEIDESSESDTSPETCVSANVFPGRPDVLYVLEDFLCLNKEQKLNDDAIEFFMSKLSERYGVMCMSPSFYTQLTTPNAEEVDKDDSYPSFVHEARSRISYNKVCRWYDDVFRHDLVFIPVWRENHYILLVVCYPRAIPYGSCACLKTPADPDMQGPAVTCIMAFDSMSKLGWVTENLVNPIRDYLTLQWLQECRGELHAVDFKCVELVKMHTPQQKNEYDCGLCVLRMVEAVVGCPPEVDDLKFDVSGRRVPMMYMNAFRMNIMKDYREKLKCEMRQCSIEQGRWNEKWDQLFDVK